MIDKSAGFYVKAGNILWWQISGIFGAFPNIKVTYRIIGEDDVVHDKAVLIAAVNEGTGGQTGSTPSHAVIPITGSLVSVAISTGAGPQRGTCYFQLMVLDGVPLTEHNILRILMCRHIQSSDFYGWPDSILKSIEDAPSHIAWDQPPDPPVGGDYSAQIQGSYKYIRSERIHLIGFRGTLKTSAAGGLRRAALQLKGGQAVVAHVPSPVTQGPGETKNYYWAVGANTSAANNNPIIALPVTFVIDGPFTGFLLGTNTIGLQEGDQWSGLQLFFKGWGTW